jgi:hypothetical protein
MVRKICGPKRSDWEVRITYTMRNIFICVGHLVLVFLVWWHDGRWTKNENRVGREKECIQKLGGKTCWHTASSKTEKEAGNNIKTDLRKTACRGIRWVKHAQDLVQWWGFVLTMSNFRVLLPKVLLVRHLLNQIMSYLARYMLGNLQTVK